MYVCVDVFDFVYSGLCLVLHMLLYPAVFVCLREFSMSAFARAIYTICKAEYRVHVCKFVNACS